MTRCRGGCRRRPKAFDVRPRARPDAVRRDQHSRLGDSLATCVKGSSVLENDDTNPENNPENSSENNPEDTAPPVKKAAAKKTAKAPAKKAAAKKTSAKKEK